MLGVLGCVSVLLAALLAALLAGPLRSHGQEHNEVVVVVNARNPTSHLSKAQLRKLFTGTTGFWHGVVPVKLFVRPPAGDAAKVFFGSILDMSPQAFAQHWDKLQLSGRAVAPRTVASSDELAGVIARTPGGIGFALASEVWQTNGLKVITVQ